MTERRKTQWEQFKLKEGNYKELISSLKFFYDPCPKPDSINEFLRRVNLCWLYAPDSVIRKAYAFIEIWRNTDKSGDEKNLVFGELAHELRQDMLRRKIVRHSKFTAKDFKHLKATDPSSTEGVV